MKIRKFQNKDSREVAELIRRNDLEVSSLFYSKKIIELWVKEITPEYIIRKSKNRACYVVIKNKKVVGYISFEKGNIKKLFVNPDYHKKGIGKKLMKTIEEIAHKKKIKKLILDSNIGAEKFYIHCGFKKIRNKFSKRDNQRIKMIYMEKILK